MEQKIMSRSQADLLKLVSLMPARERSRLCFQDMLPRQVLEELNMTWTYSPELLQNYERAQTQTKHCEKIPEISSSVKCDVNELIKKFISAIESGGFEAVQRTFDAPFFPKDDIKPTIVNVVGAIQLGSRVDLGRLSRNPDMWNMEFDSKSNQGMKLAVPFSNTSGQLYPNGKMVVSGGKSVAEVKQGVKFCLKTLKRAGVNTTGACKTFVIQNVMGIVDMKTKFRLNEMAHSMTYPKWSELITYDPGMAAGVAFNFRDPKLTVCCYASGKVMIAGGRSAEDIRKGFIQFHILSFPFRDSENA